jgi:polar amino acid transport system substrate-binding protein
MQSSIEVLRAEVGEEAPVAAEFLGILERETQRVHELLEQFFAYARPRPPAPAPVAPREWLEGVRSLVGPRARAAGTTLVLEVQEGLDELRADADQLRQILLNLALNALAAAPGGRVEIRCVRGPGGLEVEVSDDGEGVAEEARGRLFDPFFTTRATGVGLGLSISQRLARQNGATLSVRSPGRLRGASFHLLFGDGSAT